MMPYVAGNTIRYVTVISACTGTVQIYGDDRRKAQRPKWWRWYDIFRTWAAVLLPAPQRTCTPAPTRTATGSSLAQQRRLKRKAFLVRLALL